MEMCAIKSEGSERDSAAGKLKWPTSTDATDIQGDMNSPHDWGTSSTHFLQFYNIK